MVEQVLMSLSLGTAKILSQLDQETTAFFVEKGQDSIDAEAIGMISFRGDGFLYEGVTVDLSIGFGTGVNGEGDKYQNIEMCMVQLTAIYKKGSVRIIFV